MGVLVAAIASGTLANDWPACQEQNTVIRNAGRALFTNLQGFGATVGCFQDDCQNSDKFVASSVESCTKVCLSLPECEFWVWGQEEVNKSVGSVWAMMAGRLARVGFLEQEVAHPLARQLLAWVTLNVGWKVSTMTLAAIPNLVLAAMHSAGMGSS